MVVGSAPVAPVADIFILLCHMTPKETSHAQYGAMTAAANQDRESRESISRTMKSRRS